MIESSRTEIVRAYQWVMRSRKRESDVLTHSLKLLVGELDPCGEGDMTGSPKEESTIHTNAS